MDHKVHMPVGVGCACQLCCNLQQLQKVAVNTKYAVHSMKSNQAYRHFLLFRLVLIIKGYHKAISLSEIGRFQKRKHVRKCGVF